MKDRIRKMFSNVWNIPNVLTMIRLLLIPVFVVVFFSTPHDRNKIAALVIFAVWRPNISIFGSILFGGLYIVHNYIPGLDVSGQELFKMLPYAVTILFLVVISMRRKREAQPPAHLGLPYFREER